MFRKNIIPAADSPPQGFRGTFVLISEQSFVKEVIFENNRGYLRREWFDLWSPAAGKTPPRIRS
jgi:hypothetical protein